MACCCSCKNLDDKQKKEGEASGAKYYCKELKTLVAGDNPACEKYGTCFRSNMDIERIYKEGKSWRNDTKPVGGALAVLIILILLLILLRIFNPGLF